MSLRLQIEMRKASALCLLLLLATATGIGFIGIPGAGALAPIAHAPPNLGGLEMQMEQLHLNSERFSEVVRGSVAVTNEGNGKPVGRSRHVSLDGTVLGEASLSPAAGETFIDGKHRPSLIAVGHTLYTYDASGRGARKRRPWVRSSDPTASPAAYILPFQAGLAEVNAGGTGSFAQLINLLTTRVGPVILDGPAVVQGQQTSVFTAAVEPRLLIKGITKEDFANFEKEAPIESIQIFLTESGLPIRVVSTIRSKDLNGVDTTEILAINVPVDVKPPPARETIGRAQLRDLQAKEDHGTFSEFTFTPAALGGARKSKQ